LALTLGTEAAVASWHWWQRIRIGLREEPEVIAIADALGMDRDLVVGKLVRFWGWAKRVSNEGRLPGFSSARLDDHLEAPGFAAALLDVGWLVADPHGLSLPRYRKHNYLDPARQKDLTRERVRRHRAKKRNAGNAPDAPTPASGNAPLVTPDVTANDRYITVTGNAPVTGDVTRGTRYLSAQPQEGKASAESAVTHDVTHAVTRCNATKGDLDKKNPPLPPLRGKEGGGKELEVDPRLFSSRSNLPSDNPELFVLAKRVVQHYQRTVLPAHQPSHWGEVLIAQLKRGRSEAALCRAALGYLDWCLRHGKSPQHRLAVANFYAPDGPCGDFLDYQPADPALSRRAKVEAARRQREADEARKAAIRQEASQRPSRGDKA